MRKSVALEYRGHIERAAELQDDAMALGSIELYPRWVAGISILEGMRYQYNGVLYRAVQSHTAQADWTPNITPALFTVVSLDEWPEWVQATGAQDAYNAGDKVSHNEKRWISNSNSNVWEPGIFGWDEVEQ